MLTSYELLERGVQIDLHSILVACDRKATPVILFCISSRALSNHLTPSTYSIKGPGQVTPSESPPTKDHRVIRVLEDEKTFQENQRKAY